MKLGHLEGSQRRHAGQRTLEINEREAARGLEETHAARVAHGARVHDLHDADRGDLLKDIALNPPGEVVHGGAIGSSPAFNLVSDDCLHGPAHLRIDIDQVLDACVHDRKDRMVQELAPTNDAAGDTGRCQGAGIPTQPGVPRILRSFPRIRTIKVVPLERIGQYDRALTEGALGVPINPFDGRPELITLMIGLSD